MTLRGLKHSYLHAFAIVALTIVSAPPVSAQEIDEAFVQNFVDQYFKAMRRPCLILPAEEQVSVEWGIEDHYVRIGKLLEKMKMESAFDRLNMAAEAKLLETRQMIKCMRPDAMPLTERRTRINEAQNRANALLIETEKVIRAELKEK